MFYPVVPATPPQNCTATAITSTTVRVTWMIPSEPNGPIDHYDVTYQPGQSISGIDYTTQTELLGIASTMDNSTELNVSDLFKATSYSFSLTAYNDIGSSPYSTEPCLVYTLEDGEFSHDLGANMILSSLFLVPDGPPLNLNASSDSATSIIISWDPPAKHLQNGIIMQYIVRRTTNTFQPLFERPFVLSDGTQAVLSGLRVNTTYYISVSSRTAVGFGPYASTSARTLSARKLNAVF